MNLNSQITLFCKELESKGRSQFTITAYRKDLEQLTLYLDKAKVKSWPQATFKVLDKYIQDLFENQDYTPKTISRKINSMKTFYKFLISRKIITKDHAAAISHPRLEKSFPRVLSPLEYKALRDTARSNLRLYTIIETLLQTGMRIGELSRLKLADVDRSGNLITVQAFSSYPARQIEINPALKTALENYLTKLNDSSEFLFPTKTGKQLLVRNIRSTINSAFKKTGIKDATVNDLRNTFIFHQLEKGLRLEKLSYTVGHKKISTTENYLEFIETRPQKISNKIFAL